MTNTPRQGQAATITATGEKVFILSIDSDTSCAVWVVYAADCDRDAMLPRAALTF
jgi:hypothetical protein